MTDALKVATAAYNAAHSTSSLLVAVGEEHESPIMMARLTDGTLVGVDVYGLGKEAIALLHAHLATLPVIETVILVLESWVHRAEAGDKVGDAILRGDLSVSEVPNRKEAVIFNIRVGARQFLAVCDIDRQAQTLAKAELVDVDAPGQTFAGRFIKDGRRPFDKRVN